MQKSASAIKQSLLISVMAIMLFSLSVMVSSAGDVTLSLNTGTGNSPYRILGESSMVINGFDLNAFGITRPTQIDRVSISVANATGAPATVVIYEDANGGSPVDATLARQQQVTITTNGIFTVEFADPVTINQPVVWIGFYLPVDFEFNADTSGASVLSYWAWQPGSTFDVANLGSAGVLGPSNGTDPVGLNMGGIARITADFITSDTVVNNGTTTDSTASTDTTAVAGDTADDDEIIRQVVAQSGQNVTPPMATYAGCGTLYVDRADIDITYRMGIRFFCRVVPISLAPPIPDNYTRGGALYDVFAFNGPPTGIATRFSSPVTHCVAPLANDLNSAVLGIAYGVPRQWEILPSVRFGTLVCAELSYAGTVSYFVPNN